MGVTDGEDTARRRFLRGWFSRFIVEIESDRKSGTRWVGRVLDELVTDGNFAGTESTSP